MHFKIIVRYSLLLIATQSLLSCTEIKQRKKCVVDKTLKVNESEFKSLLAY